MASMMSLQSNLTSMNAIRHLQVNQSGLEKSLGRLSSGFRINSAADDAAGLAISENLRAQIRSLQQAERNANDASSVVNTAEGAMQEVSNILVRLRELAVQAASDTLGNSERAFLHLEFNDLKAEIDRISSTTEFNGQKLLDGSVSATGLDFQVGVNNGTNDRITLRVDLLSSEGLGLATAVGVDTKVKARTAMSVIDGALTELSSSRATLGALGNRLQSTLNNLGIQRESLSAANSRIRDVDVASETSTFARAQVLVQAGVSMLAQANAQPNNMMRLLQQ